MNDIIAVTIGDIKGIGIELLIKLWKNKKNNNFVLFTNLKIFKNYLKNKKLNIKINIINNQLNFLSKIDYKNKINLYNYECKNNEDNTYKSLYNSYQLTKKKYFIGILTLPLNKKKIIKEINNNFIGQTEYFQKIDKKNTSNMIFKKNKLIITTLTTHIKLKNINKYLAKSQYISNKIKSINKSLVNDFNIIKPKIIISGINPHAGEEGVMGDEEIKYIIPIIKKLKKNKILIDGPISGDSVLTKKNLKYYDCFIFNYHDQALIPFKMISNNSGTNFTAGLDIIRVSPDHGTAYDLVDKNKANILSIINSIKLIKKISKNRKMNIVNS